MIFYPFELILYLERRIFITFVNVGKEKDFEMVVLGFKVKGESDKFCQVDFKVLTLF